MKNSDINLRKFDLSTMAENATIIMIARRGAGKTTTIKEICYTKRKMACGVLICPTERMNGEYKFFFPDLFIHYDVDVALIEKILSRQTIMIEKMKNKKKIGMTLDPSILLVMDDCMSEKGVWKKSTAVKAIFVEGRHYMITYVLAMQNIKDLGPEFRNNFDYAFLFLNKISAEIEKIRTAYVGLPKSTFEKTFRACTTNYGCMVVDYKSPSSSIDEQIFFYRTQKQDLNREFAFGSKRFRDYHKKYYDPEYQKNAMLAKIKDEKGPDIILRE